MAKRKRGFAKRAARTIFARRTKSRGRNFGSDNKLIQPHLMVYGAVRDKAANFIPDLSMGMFPKGASDILVLAGAGYLAAKQKGMVGQFGKAMLHGENYEAGKLAGSLVFGAVPSSATNSLFYA